MNVCQRSPGGVNQFPKNDWEMGKSNRLASSVDGKQRSILFSFPLFPSSHVAPFLTLNHVPEAVVRVTTYNAVAREPRKAPLGGSNHSNAEGELHLMTRLSFPRAFGLLAHVRHKDSSYVPDWQGH